MPAALFQLDRTLREFCVIVGRRLEDRIPL
jgi:hypothetical protein